MNLKRILFLGQGRLASLALQILDKAVKRGGFTINAVCSDALFYDDYCRWNPRTKAVHLSNAKRNTKEMLKILRKQRIDMIVSVQHPWVLERSVIEAVDGYALNLHNAQLPKYKGYNSISHAIINEDSVYTTSLHWIIEQVDAGDICLTREVPISKWDDARSLYLKTLGEVEAILSHLSGMLSDGSEVPSVKISGSGAFYKRSSLEEIKDVSKLTDENLINRIIRGCFFPPYEPAYTRNGVHKVYLAPPWRREGIKDSRLPVNAARWY